MEVEYLDIDQQESITNEQIEEIAFIDLEREKICCYINIR